MPFLQSFREILSGSDASLVSVLAPGFEDGDGDGVAEVEATIPRPHWQADALFWREGVSDAFW